MYLCYVPCPDEKTAKALGRTAVEKKLAACANIVSGMTSIYEWNGKIEEAVEVLLLLKTRAEVRGELETLILGEHPYDVPCVTFYEAKNVNSSFLEWVRKQTS